MISGVGARKNSIGLITTVFAGGEDIATSETPSGRQSFVSAIHVQFWILYLPLFPANPILAISVHQSCIAKKLLDVPFFCHAL